MKKKTSLFLYYIKENSLLAGLQPESVVSSKLDLNSLRSDSVRLPCAGGCNSQILEGNCRRKKLQ